MRPWTLRLALLSLVIGGASACSTSTAGPATVTQPAQPGAAVTELASVTPKGGAVGVAVNSPIVIAFSHAMQSDMAMYVALHQNGVTGPGVACTATWSSDRTMLTVTPSAPLQMATLYTLHVGGGMMDSTGNIIDMVQYGMTMGGQWATASMMMGGGMMGGGSNEMGPGWQGMNGMYGMVFGFTTL